MPANHDPQPDGSGPPGVGQTGSPVSAGGDGPAAVGPSRLTQPAEARASTLAGIHHIKLPVSDVARSRAWYARVLGFETSIEFVEDGVVAGVALRREGCPPQIALRHDPERARALSGFDAVALLVASRDEVRRWSTQLETLGEPHGGIVTGHLGGSILVGLHDPDGLEIRLYAD